jgi:hypothetical protein
MVPYLFELYKSQECTSQVEVVSRLLMLTAKYKWIWQKPTVKIHLGMEWSEFADPHCVLWSILMTIASNNALHFLHIPCLTAIRHSLAGRSRWTIVLSRHCFRCPQAVRRLSLSDSSSWHQIACSIGLMSLRSWCAHDLEWGCHGVLSCCLVRITAELCSHIVPCVIPQCTSFDKNLE